MVAKSNREGLLTAWRENPRTLYVVGVSGGKDSGAVATWMLKESGIPSDQIRLVANETENEDIETYAQIALFSILLHPVIWLIPELGFYDLALKKKGFPSRRRRFCTQYLKMQPTKEYIEDLQSQGYEVISVSGVRADESTSRADLPEVSPPMDSYFNCWIWRPILKWKIEDVFLIHKKYNIPLNKLYALGFGRVGCFPCINETKAGVRLIAAKRPERIAYLREKEKWISAELGKAISFFNRNTTPMVFHSADYTMNNGEQVKLPLIDDVVAWSKTSNGKLRGRQFTLGFEEELASDDAGVCPSQMGVCE